MTYRGRVENGAVVLDEPNALPEGTEVRVSPVRATKSPNRSAKAAPATLNERLKPVIGKATTLPPDMSANHDHYLYGVPKQPPPKRGGKRRGGAGRR